MAQSKRKPVAKKPVTRKPRPKASPKKTVKKAVSTTAKKLGVRKKTMPVKTKAKKPQTNDKSFAAYTDIQKNELLLIIEKIVRLRYLDKDGLKSLALVARILDPGNQKYTLPGSKFDAIIRHSMVENPAVLHEHIYVFVHSRDKETTEFYLCLSQIGAGKMTFAEARMKLEKMYHTAFETRHRLNVT